MMGVDGTNEVHTTAFGAFLREVSAELASARPHSPSMPISRADWRRFQKGVTPRPGESLRGLVYRSCAINGIPNSWGLLQHMAMSHRNRITISEDARLELEQLAHAIGVSDGDVVSRRYSDLGRDHRSFFGLDVHRSRIENRVRRFSPTAFRVDAEARIDTLDPDYATHRALWELRDIPFCLDGWDMLQERCWCESQGVVQGWTRTATHLHECDTCGDPLSELEAFSVPLDMRPALSIIAALVHPEKLKRQNAAARLPDTLRAADRSKVFSILVKMAHLIHPDARDYPMQDVRSCLYGLWKACDVLSRWPDSVHELVFPTGTSPEAVKRIMAAINRITLGYSAGKKRMRTLKAVGIVPATRIAKLSTDVLRSAWESGLITRHHRVHGPRKLMAFDQIEIEQFGEEWRCRVTPDSFAEELGIPNYGIEQIAAMEIVVPDAPALPGTGPHFSPETVERFLGSIEEKVAREGQSVSPIQDPVSLSEAMRHIGGRAKPWGAVFGQLINGTIPFEIQPNTNVASSIMISAAYIRTLVTIRFEREDFDFDFSPRITQDDALNLLNLSSTGVRSLEGLAARGRNPKFYMLADVEERAATMISMSEIAMMLRMTPAEAYWEMQRRKMDSVRPGLWDRAAIMAELGLR